jgi:hypothetical protein
MTFGDCVTIFKTQTTASNFLKPFAKIYRAEAIASILKSWPELESVDVRRISAKDCNTWATKFSGQYSGARFNGAVGVLRAVFKIAIESGALYRNPAEVIKRAKIHPIQYATQSADPIELRVYRGANGSFTLYEDEGDNYNYESGSYATIPITWNESTKTLILGARQGSFPGMLASRTFRIVWVGASHGTGVSTTTSMDAIVNYGGGGMQVYGGN